MDGEEIIIGRVNEETNESNIYKINYSWDNEWGWVESVFIINDVIVDDSDTTPWPFKT